MLLRNGFNFLEPIVYIHQKELNVDKFQSKAFTVTCFKARHLLLHYFKFKCCIKCVWQSGMSMVALIDAHDAFRWYSLRWKKANIDC
jgi:hypothetical protein